MQLDQAARTIQNHCDIQKIVLLVLLPYDIPNTSKTKNKVPIRKVKQKCAYLVTCQLCICQASQAPNIQNNLHATIVMIKDFDSSNE